MIETENVYKSYEADGEQRVWDFPYAVDNVSDVKVYVSHDDVLTQVDSSKYSYNGTTKKVTYPSDGAEPAVPSGDIVLIWRQTPIVQEESSAVNNFKSDDVERMVDKLTIICQELSDKLGRAIVWDPTQQYETDAKTYLDDLTALKDTATTQAGIATTKAGEAAASAISADASATKSQKWAEGTDQEVAALGGTHSSKGWAAISQAAAESEAVQTVVANIQDINDVASIKNDVTNVASIKNAIVSVNDNESAILNVSDNIASVNTVANSTNMNSINTVAGIKDDVNTVAGISSEVTAVSGNATNINAVAGNATNINAVNANKTNIDAVAGIAADVTTVATNATDIGTVATNIADVTAVADDSTNIDAVADDLTNIDLVAGSLSDIQDKQNKTLTTSLTIGGVTQTTVEGALGALNSAKQDNITVINGGDSTNA